MREDKTKVLAILISELEKLEKLKVEVEENTNKLKDSSSRDEINDGGYNMQVKNQNKSVISGINNSIEAIREAIELVKEGRYGICEVCKDVISDARLEIKPWSKRCVRCS